MHDGCVPVWLETGPDLLQLIARRLNLRRVLGLARPAIQILSGINPRLVGGLILPAGFGKVILDGFHLGSLLAGEPQLLLEAGREDGFLAQRSVIFQRHLVFQGLGEREGIGVGVRVLRRQSWRGQHQRAADDGKAEHGFHVVAGVSAVLAMDVFHKLIRSDGSVGAG